MSSSLLPTKAVFTQKGLKPYLHTTKERCAICLKDLACSAPSPHRPLNEAEKAFLESSSSPLQILTLKAHHKHTPIPHHRDIQQPCLKLVACGHVFGSTCITEWFEGGSTSCPLCRRELFVPEPKDEAWFEERERREAEEYWWEGVVGHGRSPFLTMGGGFF